MVDIFLSFLVNTVRRKATTAVLRSCCCCSSPMEDLSASGSAYNLLHRRGLRRLNFKSFVEGIYECAFVGSCLVAQELGSSYHDFVSVCCQGFHGLLQELVERHRARFFAAIEEFRAYPGWNHLKHADPCVPKLEPQRL